MRGERGLRRDIPRSVAIWALTIGVGFLLAGSQLGLLFNGGAP